MSINDFVNNVVDILSAGKAILLAFAAIFAGFKWLGYYMRSNDNDLDNALKGLIIRAVVIIGSAEIANLIIDAALNTMRI